MRKTMHHGVARPSRPASWNRFRSAGMMRRGSLFHYTLIYMTLASALLALAGVCLHTILKADSADRRESLFLTSLIRAERQLREDSEAGVAFESESAISVVSSQQTQISWTTDRGILRRTEKRGDEVMNSDRFIFPAGSQVLFAVDESMDVIVKVVEPSVFVKYIAAGNGGSHLSKPVKESSPVTPSHVAQPGSVEIRLRGVKP